MLGLVADADAGHADDGDDDWHITVHHHHTTKDMAKRWIRMIQNQRKIFQMKM